MIEALIFVGVVVTIGAINDVEAEGSSVLFPAALVFIIVGGIALSFNN